MPCFFNVKVTITNPRLEKTETTLQFGLYHQFIFIPVFSLGRVSGTPSPHVVRLEIPPVFSNLWQFCWLHTKTGPSKVGVVIKPPGPCSTSGPVSRGCGQQDLPRDLSWDNLVTWPNHYSWDLSIWRTAAQHFGLYEFYSCAFYREVSRREHFIKIPSLARALEVALFQ